MGNSLKESAHSNLRLAISGCLAGRIESVYLLITRFSGEVFSDGNERSSQLQGIAWRK